MSASDDNGDPLTYTITLAPPRGQITLTEPHSGTFHYTPNNPALTATLVNPPAKGRLALQPNSDFVYTPSVGLGGLDSFIYRADDGHSVSGPVTVQLSLGGGAQSHPDHRRQWSGKRGD